MEHKDVKPPFRWSIKRQFMLYILISTILITVFTFGLSKLSQVVTLNDTTYLDPAANNSRLLQPPLKGLFRVPTLTADQNGSRVGFEMNSEAVQLMYGFKQNIIEDYQSVFLIGFLILILLQFLFSYYFIKHKFINPLAEASSDLEKLVEGIYCLDEKYPSVNEINQLRFHIFKLSKALEDSDRFRDLSEQQRKTLIAGLSHDLKTPLTNIIGYSETLQMNGDMSDEGKAYLDIIYRNAVIANQMIGNITNVNRLNKMETEKTFSFVDLPLVFNNCVEDFSDALKKNNQTIESKFIEVAAVLTDLELLRRIFNNLLQNFINHSGKDSKLVATAYYENENLVITFTDNGKGAPKHLIPRLTELMYKVDDARGERENSGIGLYNVSKIVEILNGHLEIESDEGQGMSIVIKLPKQIESEYQMEG